MATVKTVLVKGRSNRSGKFPLVVQVLHKRRKKVVYTGFSIPDTLFDPVKGRVIDGGETPRSRFGGSTTGAKVSQGYC